MNDKNEERRIRIGSVLIICVVLTILVLISIGKTNQSKDTSFEPKSLSEISYKFQDRTTMQENKLIKDIAGKDIKSEAIITDIVEKLDKITIYTQEGINLVVQNNTENEKKLLLYDKKDSIKFEGKVKKIMESELVSEGRFEVPLIIEINNILKK